jgi:hypothetical protein
MQGSPRIRLQLASEHVADLRANALLRGTRRGFRLRLRRLRIVGRWPLATPKPRAAR